MLIDAAQQETADSVDVNDPLPSTCDTGTQCNVKPRGRSHAVQVNLKPKMVSVGTQTQTSTPLTSPEQTDDEDDPSVISDSSWVPGGHMSHLGIDKFIVCQEVLMSLFALCPACCEKSDSLCIMWLPTFLAKPANAPQEHGPQEESHFGGVWPDVTLPHWRPMWGSSDQDGTRKGCPSYTGATSRGRGQPPQHQLPLNGTEERGGSAATATGNRLPLASPGSSLEQPRPAAPLPGDQEPKAPCSRRRWEGDHASSPWWRGVTQRLFQALREATSAAQLSGLLQNPSSQPLQPATPETPPPAGAAAPGLRSPGRRGRVGLACDPGEVWR
ncbi:hypothetical protein N1851_028368 [Merluccius polli]|uniref:Uncharacterized protein n=1 Tax=Merluccius polli TaxID=89951 RepID=A0AA47M8U9_MERPO|nr:hypothetical protein N1851_028368 [Merluccius polli]